jgi:hypothetical protein
MKRRNFLLASSGLAGSSLFAPLVRAAQPCPPPQVSVSGGSIVATACPTTSSTLSVLAASMPAGTWSQISVSNQNAMVGVGTQSGSMIHYCNSMPWNPISKAIEVLAMDHNYGRLRYVRYVEPSNQFTLMADDVGLGGMTQHGYDHVSVNPYTGDLYYRQYSVNSGTIKCFRKAQGSVSTFTALPALASNNGVEQAAIGSCWWSGSFAGGGTQGSLIIFNSGNALGNANDGQIGAYNPLTNSWFFNKPAMSPYYGSGATYHSVIEYSRVKNVAVYGGGNVAGNKLWRLNADGSYTTMPNVPSGKGVGMQQGNLVADPVTGNFLLLSAGQLWELNPTGAGTWTQLTGSRTPPGGVGRPDAPAGVISTAIADHGVIAYITQSSPSGGTFFIYKHA